MAFDLKSGTAQPSLAKPGAGFDAVGKQTLTSQLPAIGGTMVSNAPQLDGSGGGNQPPPLDATGTIINDMLQSYQHISAMVPMPDIGLSREQAWSSANKRMIATDAQIPYWNHGYRDPASSGLPTHPQFDISLANAAYGALGLDDTPVMKGKGTPAEITSAVNAAVALDLIPKPDVVPSPDPSYWRAAWRARIERWMLQIGLGVDCSGFVYETLTKIRQTTGAQTTKEAGLGMNSIFEEYLGYDNARTKVPDERMGASGQQFTEPGDTPQPKELKAPDDLTAGDLMVTSGGTGHVRIIMQVDRTKLGTTQFTTAESTFDTRFKGGPHLIHNDVPTTPRNGPRIHYWRYVSDVLEERYEGSQEWKESEEDPRYSRQLVIPSSTAAPASGEA